MITVEVLQQDMIAAMKSKDNIKKSALSSAISAIKKAAIDKNCRDNITEELIVDCIRKEIKILDEQIATCPADREQLIAEFTDKKSVLSFYVPTLVTDEAEVCRMITSLLRDITIVDKGQVMKLVMPQLKGKVDMKVANKVITDFFKGER